jgi:hypothetical protein
MFKPAKQQHSHQRIALVGPTGSGKSYSALSLAGSGRVALLSLEGSAPRPAWEGSYDQCSASDLTDLLTLIELAHTEKYTTIILDCLSSVWTGPKGLLALIDQHQGRGWGMVDTQLAKLYAAIHAYPGHVIATFRAEEVRLVVEKEGVHRIVSQVGKVSFKADFGAQFGMIFEMLGGGLADCKKGPPSVYGQLLRLDAGLGLLPLGADPETTPNPSETGTSTPSSGSKTNGQSGEAITIKNLREAARDLVGAGFSVDRVTVVLATHGGEFSEKGALVGMPVAHRPACLSEMIALACEGTGVAL